MSTLSYRIHTLRIIAIIGIIFHHSMFFQLKTGEFSAAHYFYCQFFNYGSLLFILISGFLFEKSIKRHSPISVMKRKIRFMLIPYLVFVTPWILVKLFVAPYLGRERYTPDFWEIIYSIFFKTNYWFVFSLFISQVLNCFMLRLSKYKGVFIVSILITLFYSLNIYTQLIPSDHTMAIPAFFSFFFTGRFLFKYKNSSIRLYSKIIALPYFKPVFFSMLILLYFTAILESYYIKTNTPLADASNVLRFSNILLTMMLIAVFFRFSPHIPRFKGVTNIHVFLIYLIHPYVLNAGVILSALINLEYPSFLPRYVSANFLYGCFVFTSSLLAAQIILSLQPFKLLFAIKKRIPQVQASSPVHIPDNKRKMEDPIIL